MISNFKKQNARFIAEYSGEYKIGFMNYVDNTIRIYDTYIHCKGILIFGNDVSDSTFMKDIDFESIVNFSISEFKGKKCIVVEYRYNSSYSIISSNNTEKIYIFGLKDFEECKLKTQKAIDNFFNKKRQQHLAEIETQKLLQQQKDEATEFYNNCLKFHIKDNTPSFYLFKEDDEAKAVVVFITEDKNLNFLKIDGETKNEDVGVIAYDKIHYYEKAGNVHYVTETNGSYSSFGGSLTGATFSKKAALFHGIMFGPMGMATAALMSYKPAQQKPAETHFDLTSETKRIDERNVLLNFYSDDKGQYIDIELPQEIYNFFQTHLPEKKYEIVSEVEKHNAVNKAIDEQKSINAPEEKAALPNTKKLSFDEFKEKVDKLKIMKDAELLSDEEFNAEKAKLLALI